VRDTLLSNKVAIVTGSTKGIGLEIAKTLLANGASVAINSRTPSDVKAVVEILGKNTGNDSIVGAPGDVSSFEECEKIVEKTVSKFGALNILVNNAGVSMIHPSLTLTQSDWRRTLDTNLSGVFYMSQLSAQKMAAKGGGSIVNLSSILGETGLPRRAAYCASKAGLIGLTKALATEWASLNIRVNCVSPGYIQTPMDVKDRVTGDYEDSDIVDRTPLGRYGTVAEVAQLALFLASDASSYVTGANMVVDGGWLAYGGWDKLLEQLRQAKQP
jgi:3-oxoacyl-[acyl-carrier protein] reductase